MNRLSENCGISTGKSSENSILDTHMYDVEYPYGNMSSLAANVIVENICVQADSEGERQVLFEEIIDHQNEVS